MPTFCKTSQGGFNLDNVTQWYRYINGDLIVWFCAPGDIKEGENGNAVFVDKEAQRVFDILNGVCIFNATGD